MDQLAALPVWAQQEIRTLREQVEHLRGQMGQFPQSNTTYGVEASGTKGNLPHESRVQFYEDPNSSKCIEAYMSESEKCLYLVGRGPLLVIPCAANSVRVKLGNRS